MIDKAKISKGPVGYVPDTALVMCGKDRIADLRVADHLAINRTHGYFIAEAFKTFTETGMTPAELGKVYKLAKALHYAQSLWNTAMDSRDPDAADRADTEIAKAQGELYGLMDTLHKGK